MVATRLSRGAGDSQDSHSCTWDGVATGDWQGMGQRADMLAFHAEGLASKGFVTFFLLKT